MAECRGESTGMVVLQAESKVAAINMVYGGAGTGKKVMASSSSPGVSLKQRYFLYRGAGFLDSDRERYAWRIQLGTIQPESG